MNDVINDSTTPKMPAQYVPAAVTAPSVDVAMQSSSFDLLRTRLNAHGASLAQQAGALNSARLDEFGRADTVLLARTRARTENNCVARDLVQVGESLVFGYNVFIGLRKEVRVADVFALYRMRENGAEVNLEVQKLDGSFLNDPRFVTEFTELYNYYRNAQLAQLRVNQGKLLAAFKIGDRATDLRVFRWQIETNGALTYIDNRGERDMALPPTHDFEWLTTSRDQHVIGKYPHINILDILFVETIGGDLTIKLENNTETGLGIYSEPVEDKNQSLTDAEVAYAAVGQLILLRIKPYRETAVRFLAFNRLTQVVMRVDAIGESCVQLPEDHGIVFPDGYILQSGEHKQFADMPRDLKFKRRVLAPNGEDVLYVFYGFTAGTYVLLAYNLIAKTLAQPLVAQGYARFDNGKILLFTEETPEPTRNHGMQLWQTPFLSDEHAAQQAPRQTALGKIGNRELVRGVSELYSVAKLVREQSDTGESKLPSRFVYETLIKQCQRTLDGHYWLQNDSISAAAASLLHIIEVAKNTLDEFDKVAAVQRQAQQALSQAELENRQLLTDTASKIWQSPTDFSDALAHIRLNAGKLSVLEGQRYINAAKLQQLQIELAAEEGRISGLTVSFLGRDDAFNKLNTALAAQRTQLPNCLTTAALAPLLAVLDKTAESLGSLTNLLATLNVADATLRTKILSTISGFFAEVNKLRAQVLQHRKALTQTESAAEFAAQFALLGQSVESALEQAITSEKCDEQLTRLLVQLEELEGRFTEQDSYLSEIAFKRESVYAAFEARKQGLLAARTKRVQTIQEAGHRILAGVPKRLAALDLPAQIEAYFAADALIKKLKNSIADLRQLGSDVAADDLSGQLKNQREQGLRNVRDRNELGGGNVIRLGQHGFTINQQTLDLSIVIHKQQLSYHLTGTDYFLAFEDARLATLEPYWQLDTIAESATVYRAEYLAYQIVLAAQENREGFTFKQLLADVANADVAVLDDVVRRFAAPRYQEAYQKGVHDSDAALVLRATAPMLATAGFLRYNPLCRALALLFWQHATTPLPHQNELPVASQALQLQAQQATLMHQQFGSDSLLKQLTIITADAIEKFVIAQQLEIHSLVDPVTQPLHLLAQESAAYLLAELGAATTNTAAPRLHEWVLSSAGATLVKKLQVHFAAGVQASPWQNKLLSLNARWQLACSWLRSFVDAHIATPDLGSDTGERRAQQMSVLPEAAAALLVDFHRNTLSTDLQKTVSGLLGQHALLRTHESMQSHTLQLNDFLRRLQHHCKVVVPAFLQLQQLRQTLMMEEKARLRLEQFQAKPLSSFVRSRLINEVYLPMVGDNLAKQIGAAGDARRTDSMGLLLLISPPGYGKTTLMEYLCDRLGMIFVRINCPVLGHDVVSLDPTQTANSAAKVELEKLNLGLAMGSNVMLYLDDIQHTNPEFLQKFIGLADGTRRIEGVWREQNHTYDLRGKRFAIVMAGNPYTESGAVFKIPDMLANRADIYNLGDVLSGHEDVFAMSYIENALVAHPVLQPLSMRDPGDIYVLLRMATEGLAISANSGVGELKHPYTSEEISEILAVLQRLFKVRDALLQVNKTYIASAAQDNLNRIEPPFKLQGSYRNMIKLTPKVSALMRDEELNNLLLDHYRGEAQTLTTGAEENLLKLAHLLGKPTRPEQVRWQSLLANVARLRKQGGADADGATKVANTLSDIGAQIASLTKQTELNMKNQPDVQINLPDHAALQNAMLRMAESYEQTLLPMLSAMNHKMRLDHSIWDGVREISANMSEMDKRLVQMSRVRAGEGADPVPVKKKEK